MKKLNNFILGLMSVCAFTLGACTDDAPSDDFGQSPQVEGAGVYFPNSMSAYRTVGSATDPEEETTKSGIVTLPVERTNVGEAVTVEVKAVMSAEAAEVLDVPASVSFEADKKETELVITVTDAQRGTPYKVEITFADGTEYANSTKAITVEFPALEIWEIVSENAVYIDQLFNMFGASDIVLDGLTVEKLQDKNKYRFKSPYDNTYFEDVFGISGLMPADFEAPYIVLDGEKYLPKKDDGTEYQEGEAAPELCKYYIAPTALGWKMVNGVGPEAAASWNTFGSFAYNLSDNSGPLTEDKYPLGSFNKKKEMFELGVIYHNIESVGFYDCSGFQLWLDPTKMEIVYDRDYAPWENDEAATGTFESGFLKEKFIVAVDKGTSGEEEDPIYRLNSLYAEGVNIAFFHNKETNKLRVPKQQNTGLTSYGNPIYMDVKKAAYDADTKLYTFEAEFYLVDSETGKKSYVLSTATEKFYEGKVTKIEDYLGKWTFKQIEVIDQQGTKEEVTYNVNISKKDETSVTVSGISGAPANVFDDSMTMTFNPENGTLVWEGNQPFPQFQGMDVLGMFYAGQSYVSATMIGGLDENNNLKFQDAAENPAKVAGFQLVALQGGQPAGALADIFNFTWNKSEAVDPAPAPVAYYRSYADDLKMKATPVSKQRYNAGDFKLHIERTSLQLID